MQVAPYSTRFIATNTTGSWVVYTVPTGRRAVIQSVTCVVYGTTATTFQVYVKTTYLVNVALQGNTSQAFVNLRTPVYGGEAIGASVTSAQGHITVSGYLFEDDGQAKEPATELVGKTQVLPAA